MDAVLRTAAKSYEKMPCKETATAYWSAWSRITPDAIICPVDCYEKAVKLLSMKAEAPNLFRWAVDDQRVFTFLKKLLSKYPEKDVSVNAGEYFFPWKEGAHYLDNDGYRNIVKDRPVTALTTEERSALIQWFRRKTSAMQLNVNLPRHAFLSQSLQNRNSVLWYWQIRAEPGYGIRPEPWY